MATLTADMTPHDQPEFNEAEQEAYAIGEAAEEEQNKMLAGKFKDAEALEQAYIELQKKLGENNAEEGLQGQRQEEQVTDEPPSEIDTIFAGATIEYNEKGELSADTIEKLSSMDSADLVNAYLKSVQQPEQVADLSDAEAESIMGIAGGRDQYTQLVNWASENMSEEYVLAFDQVIDSGDPNTIKLAVRGLMADFESQNGREGQLLSGKAAAIKPDVFRSQAEVVQAMSDPRYDRDPAYRMDVFEKLSRSDIEY